MTKKENQMVHQRKLETRDVLLATAKMYLKTRLVSATVRDIVEHFKKQSDPWHLNYEFYHECSNIRHSQIFNLVLELKGFEPFYNKTYGQILIRKKRK